MRTEAWFSVGVLSSFFSTLTFEQRATAQSSPSTISSETSATVTAEAGTGDFKNWAGYYHNYMNGQTFESPTDSSINHYVEIGRQFLNEWYVGMVGRFDSEWTSENQQKNLAADHFVKLNFPTFYDDGISATVFGQIRYYAPTSQASKDIGQNARIEARVAFEDTVGEDIDVTSTFIPVVYSYKTDEDGQVTLEVGNYVSASYSVTPIVSVGLGAYPQWTFSRRQKGSNFNEFPIYPGATIDVTDNFSVSSYIEILAARPRLETSAIGGSISLKMF